MTKIAGTDFENYLSSNLIKTVSLHHCDRYVMHKDLYRHLMIKELKGSGLNYLAKHIYIDLDMLIMEDEFLEEK